MPVEAILVTDAEIDHTLGTVLLREGGHLSLYVTAAVQAVLEHDSRVLPLTRAFAEVSITSLPLGASVVLRDRDGAASGLVAEAFAVPGGPPRFATSSAEGHTIGIELRAEAGGGTCAFVPGCGDLCPALLDRLARADVLLFDGTFWSDDEMITLGLSDRTARQMDHLPMSGPGGSLEQLARLPCRHRIYTHINNTNPALVEHSAERALIEQAGLIVGMDGLRIEV